MAASETPAPPPSPLSRQISSSVLRRSASILSGGVAHVEAINEDVLPSAPSGGPSEHLLGRRVSQRQVDSEAVQRRLRDEAMQNFRQQIFTGRVLVGIVFFTVFAFTTAFTNLIVFLHAVFASLASGDKPCDQPLLQNYIWVTVIMGSVSNNFSRQVRQFVQSRTNSTRTVSLAGTVAQVLPSWCTIYWGLSMVRACHTCQETSPYLFRATRNYIYFQVFLAILYMAIYLPILLYGHWFFMRLQTMLRSAETRGCAEIVRERLPKIASDSDELMDPEDSSIRECSICLESLGKQTVVKTPCSHYYHMDCLSHWCESNVSCPLCKGLIADPDAGSPEGVFAQEP